MTGDHTSVIYGTHYPERLFVGCLPANAKAEELGTFFSKFGTVVEAKIVLDEKGNSKKYGFVTFSKPDYVNGVIEKEEVVFKGKKINVGPAVKKKLEKTEESTSAASKTTTTTTITKQSAGKVAPTTHRNHFPKTIIRKSPTECVESPFGFNNFTNFTTDHTFCSLWGISNTANSIWETQPPSEPLPSDFQFDRSFSLFDQLRANIHGDDGSFQSGCSYSNAVRVAADKFKSFNNYR